MALGVDYISLEDLKERLTVEDTVDDALLTAAIKAASRGINQECGRDFQQADVATPRLYRPTSATLVITHDLYTQDGLLVEIDTDDDGVHETTVLASAYELEPMDGVQNGQIGWPFWRIRLVDGTEFPLGRRHTVRVTAKWGWAAVPDDITQAAYVLAEDIAKLRDAPFGVGGFGEYGRIRARQNPHVAMLIKDYQRNTVRVA
ncbi:head-tail connector protein [Prauserella flavalba]|uniref:head-tail connector protein n=1 Tax=Prauserella flavalba TaxID=1477506 RepID=UPI0036E2E393